jgi:hypothetical protein
MIWILNQVIFAVGSTIGIFVSIFPISPFVFVVNLGAAWIGYLNFIFPIAAVISHLEMYVVVVAVYYSYRVLGRWMKLVGD